MAAPSKRARKTRDANEFDLSRVNQELRAPVTSSPAFAWSLADIKMARDEQLSGRFLLPSKMAAAMRTDDALAVAYENRLAPQRCLPVEMTPANASEAAKSIAAEADALFGQNGVGIAPETLADIHGCLVNHGVAFAVVVTTPRDDGTRVDFELRAWPIEFVRWDANARMFVTRVDPESMAKGDQPNVPELFVGGFEIPITHGDGRWVVFKKHELTPWTQEAAVLPAAFVWARHAFALKDWAKGSVAHGSAKALGELPAGMPLQNKDGSLTAEATAMLQLLREMGSGDTPALIKPAGSKVEFVTNDSTAWQVWEQLVLNGEKAAARIYLGTDGTLGANGGAPGVDITALFGVATTRVEGDLRCIERAILTGVIEPWCAVNFGDSRLAPTRRYVRPDPDSAAMHDQLAKREAAFFAAVKSSRENGFVVDQSFVDDLARTHEIAAPKLPAEASKAPSIALAPTDIARVVTVNEARASAGVGPLLMPDGSPDPDGRLTVEQFSAKKAAEAVAPSEATKTALRAIDAKLDTLDALGRDDRSRMTDEERAEHRAKMQAALLADIREAKAVGITLDVAELAKRYGVPTPKKSEADT